MYCYNIYEPKQAEKIYSKSILRARIYLMYILHPIFSDPIFSEDMVSRLALMTAKRFFTIYHESR